ncbi:MAG: hypothetical protein IJZ16_07030 [Clostridia bacterium]|nr:hypothetical protein [Clostridia bacterium]
MADLKSLLGDKYTEGMTVEDILALDVEEPQIDMSKFVSKELYDRAASETANYKKQLRANMTEAEQKALADAEEKKAMQEELAKLKAEKAIAENSKGLVALGYDEKTATEVATAFMNGDFNTVIQAQAKFVDAQKKAVVADAVKNTPTPPTGNNDNALTKEQFNKMSLSEQLEVYEKTPELYNELTKK